MLYESLQLTKYIFEIGISNDNKKKRRGRYMVYVSFDKNKQNKK